MPLEFLLACTPLTERLLWEGLSIYIHLFTFLINARLNQASGTYPAGVIASASPQQKEGDERTTVRDDWPLRHLQARASVPRHRAERAAHLA